MVGRFIGDIKSVGGVKNISPSTPPREALLTFVGVWVEPTYTASPLTFETFVIGIIDFSSVVFDSVGSRGCASRIYKFGISFWLI